MGGEDKVVGARASAGCNCFRISKECEEEHLEDLIELVTAFLGISGEGAIEEVVDKAKIGLEVKI